MNAMYRTERNQQTHLLVVDDDVDMLALLSAMIENILGEQAWVQAASDARTAREELDTGLVDVLVVDLEMPEVNGLELLRFAKRRNAWTQVVVVTGRSTTGALIEAMDSGASDYLTKPVDPVTLEQVLTEGVARLRRWRNSLAQTMLARDA